MKDAFTYAEYVNLLWGALALVGGKFLNNFFQELKELKESIKKVQNDLDQNKLNEVKEFATKSNIKDLEKDVSDLKALIATVDNKVSGQYINKEDFKNTIEYLMKLVDKVESKVGGSHGKV